MTMDRRWKPLATVLRLFCIVPFLTGAADLFGGTWILAQAGASVPADVATDPIINSQIKFWGVIWLGFGAAIWWVAGDPRTRAPMLRILLATLFVSGMARALSFALYGSPGGLLTGAMILEIFGSIGMWFWHRKLPAE